MAAPCQSPAETDAIGSEILNFFGVSWSEVALYPSLPLLQDPQLYTLPSSVV